MMNRQGLERKAGGTNAGLGKAFPRRLIQPYSASPLPAEVATAWRRHALMFEHVEQQLEQELPLNTRGIEEGAAVTLSQQWQTHGMAHRWTKCSSGGQKSSSGGEEFIKTLVS